MRLREREVNGVAAVDAMQLNLRRSRVVQRKRITEMTGKRRGQRAAGRSNGWQVPRIKACLTLHSCLHGGRDRRQRLSLGDVRSAD